jgi:hypothetical protein
MNVFLIVLAGMLIALKASILQKRPALVRLYAVPKRRI